MSLRLLNCLLLKSATIALFVPSVSLPGSSARAAVLEANARYERDNFALYRGRTEAAWLSNHTGVFNLRIAAHGTTAGGSRVQGIPGGWRGYGGADISSIFAVPSLELRFLGGVDNLILPESWCGEIRVKLSPQSLPGFSAKLAASSRTLDGWFSYPLRSSSLSSAIAYDGKETWVEVGAIWDERSSARQPPTPLQLDLRNNRLATIYGWWSHELTSWLVAGFSGKWTDSKLDFHQPTQITNGVFRYSDYPYPTPHRELAWAALLELRISKLKLKASWPVASRGSYRVEDPYSVAPATFYEGRDMATAELRTSISSPISDELSLTGEVFALSRPYRAYAWFTSDAWNQLGLNLVFQYRTKPTEP
jgi:hypothetical protein